MSVSAPNEETLSDQLRKTAVELRELSSLIAATDVDPLVLRQFREAVDNVRLTAWGAQNRLNLTHGSR